MKKSLLYITMLITSISVVFAKPMPDETLNYVVTYKWGLIHKDAGDARLTLRNSGKDYVMTLTAKSKPWADRIYRVRDTLTSVVARDGFRPKRYVKAAHEDGKYMLDEIDFSHSGNKTSGAAKFTRVRKGKMSKSERQLETAGEAFDMLSIFYYIRTLDLDGMKAGEKRKSIVFSGSKSETVTITYAGKERVKLRNGQTVDSHKVRFTFTTDGKKKSSDDMEAWISTSDEHKVLRIVGKLPVGQVRVELQ